MSFIVEDGTGKADANSYLAVADADAYHADRGNASWASASEAEKQAALVKATDFIENQYSWATGQKKTKEQALSWPRYGAVDATGFAIQSTEIPKALQSATAELAFRALSVDLAPDVSRITAKEQVGPLSVEYGDRSVVPYYPVVNGTLIAGGLIDNPKTIRVYRG